MLKFGGWSFLTWVRIYEYRGEKVRMYTTPQHTTTTRVSEWVSEWVFKLNDTFFHEFTLHSSSLSALALQWVTIFQSFLLSTSYTGNTRKQWEVRKKKRTRPCFSLAVASSGGMKTISNWLKLKRNFQPKNIARTHDTFKPVRNNKHTSTHWMSLRETNNFDTLCFSLLQDRFTTYHQ